MQGRRGLLGFLAAGAIVLLLGRWLSGVYADHALHAALGTGEVWSLKARTLALLHAGTFIVATAFAFANLYAVRHSIVSLVLPSQVGGLEIAEAVPATRLTAIAATLAIVFGIGFSLLPYDWTQAALAWEGVVFGEIDPYLERDLGYYVSVLPWARTMQARAMTLLLSATAVVMALYALTPSIRWTATGLYVSAWVRRHLAVLGGLVVVTIGWGWFLDRYERLAPGSGVWLDATTEAVFSAFDHRIALPFRLLAAFSTVPIAAVLTYAGWRGHLRSAVTMLGVLIAIGPLASAVLPAVAKRPLATAEARARLRPYRNTSALYTRRAFGVDDIVRDAADATRLTPSAMAQQVSAWDGAALLAFAGDAARRDTVGTLGWQAGPAGLEAHALLSTRDPRDLTWHTLRYAASGADEAGRPYHAPAMGGGRLQQVLVHPGATRAALVADRRGDLAAAPFAEGLERLALSWAEQDPRLLARESPYPRPRLVTRRDVRDRIAAVAPFLTTGPTMTPHVRGDSLYWFAELFVTARRYPLAEGVALGGQEWRYVRHAATAVVQAQTGRVLVIPVDDPDAVMRAWVARFEGVFTPLAAAPEWIARERPPAVDWMLVQGSALAQVGFQGDSLGARRLTRTDDADADFGAGEALPFQVDSSGAMGWALPVDIPWAGRTLGVLVARGGVQRRTEFLTDEQPRWTTVLERLQGAADAAGFGRNLPNARRGRVQAIPMTDGAAWVQSYYDWPRDGLPRLAGVVVSRDGETVAARTLRGALGLPEASPALDGDAFRARVARIYDAMQAALRAGDWRAYGEAWAALGRLLERP